MSNETKRLIGTKRLKTSKKSIAQNFKKSAKHFTRKFATCHSGFIMEEGALPEAVFITSNKGGDILLDPQQFQYRSQRIVKDHTYVCMNINVCIMYVPMCINNM